VSSAFTPARDLHLEERLDAALAALVSAAAEAAGEAWRGAALGGALGLGEGFTPARPEDPRARSDPFELAAVLDCSLTEAAAHERKLQKALERTARSRHVEAHVRVLASDSLPFLPPTVENLELLAAANVVDGPADLLSHARAAGDGPARGEALRLLVKCGGRLLSAESALEKHADAASSEGALLAIQTADLAAGAAVLVSAGRFVCGAARRDEALRALGSDGGEARGFQTKMTWTRHHDLLDAHRAAVRARSAPADVPPLGELRRQLARAADRWLEVVRLAEGERLGLELTSWSAHARALGGRSAAAALFGEDDALPTRREAKRWSAAERAAPALGALLDWDPQDLGLAPRLLDLPDDAPREALRAKAAALAAEA
jgi:hypothetical protein